VLALSRLGENLSLAFILLIPPSEGVVRQHRGGIINYQPAPALRATPPQAGNQYLEYFILRYKFPSYKKKNADWHSFFIFVIFTLFYAV
jgi:hypothetical protein